MWGVKLEQGYNKVIFDFDSYSEATDFIRYALETSQSTKVIITYNKKEGEE